MISDFCQGRSFFILLKIENQKSKTRPVALLAIDLRMMMTVMIDYNLLYNF